MSHKRGINKWNSALQNRRYLKLKMKTTQSLYNYLNQKLPNKVNYDDLFNLCYSLFCTIDILPENLQKLAISKEVLGETFAKLASMKEVNSIPSENIQNKEHWISQIRTSMIIDKEPNIKNAQNLLEPNAV